MQPVNMASSQVRELTVCLLVLYSLVVLAEGLAGRGGGSRGGSRGSSSRVRYSSSGRIHSSGGSGGSLTTAQIVGIVCGVLGGTVAIIVVVLLVRRFCFKKVPSPSSSVDVSKQVVKHSNEDAVLTSPPSYPEAMSSQSENWKVTSPQLKLTPCEPTTVNNVSYNGGVAEGSGMSYPPPWSFNTPVNADGVKGAN